MASASNILFDLDGTLADPREGIFASLRYMCEGLGCPAPSVSAMEAAIGPPLHVSLQALLDSTDTLLIERAVALYRERFTHAGIIGNSVYPGIPEILATLRTAGATLFVATSKPQVFAERIVQAHGLSPYFRKVYGSELDGTRANKAELIAHLLDCEQLAPQHCVMIGDRRHDAIGARSNGVAVVGVLWGFGSREELQSHGCDRFIAAPSELSVLLG